MQPAPPPALLQENKIPLFRIDNEAVHLYDHMAYFFKDQYPLYMHRHEFYEMNIVADGTGRHYIENNSYPISKGDVFILPPNIRHGYWQTSEHMNIFRLLIEKSLLQRNQSVLQQFPGYKTLFQIEPQLRANTQLPQLFLHLSDREFEQFLVKMKELVSLAEQHKSVPATLFDIHVVSLICDLSFLIYKRNEALILNNAPNNDYYKMQVSLEYIDNNYSQPLTVQELAQNLFISKSTYMRYFKKLFNTTPMKYITAVRIEKAAALLINTDDSIAKIAQDCGFFDSSHFSNCFDKVFGVTPSQYRKNRQRVTPPRSASAPV